MGSSILKYIWFILVLASGLVATLLGLLKYGVEIDFASWARVSNKILTELPVFLGSPMVDAYGFYGGLFVFLVFLILFVMASRAGRESKSEADYSLDIDTDVPVQASDSQAIESQPDLSHLAETIQSDSFERSTETGSFEADKYSNQHESTGESAEYESDEDEYESKEDEGDDKWLESLQNIKNKDDQ